MGADPVCRRLAPGAKRRPVAGTNGGVADVFVFIADPPPREHLPGPPVTVELRGCRFEPAMVGLTVGQKLQLVNRDPTLHDIHVRGGGRTVERSLPRLGYHVDIRFTAPAVMVPITSDVHRWMRGWLGILPHPYFATTDAEGRFRLPTDGLEDGRYTLQIWHDTLGRRTVDVTLEDGQATVGLTLTAR